MYVSIGSIILLLLLSAVGTVVIIKKRRRITDAKEPENIPMTKCKFVGIPISIRSLLKRKIPLPKEEEFDALEELEKQQHNSLTEYQGRKNTKRGKLNIFEGVIPYDHNRVVLKDLVNK